MEIPWARAWLQATATSYTTAAAMPNPLTHCAGLRIEPMPPQPPALLQADSKPTVSWRERIIAFGEKTVITIQPTHHPAGPPAGAKVNHREALVG